jgi:hypothetical protein
MLRTPLPACVAIAVLLLVAAADSRAQALRSAESVDEEGLTPAQQSERLAARQNERIVSLLEQLADQARQSDDLTFAVRAQSQAATLLWPQDHERGRAIYRRAFQSLTAQTTSRPNESASGADKPSRTSLSPAERLQIRDELLNQIAARDPELADELARKLAESAVQKDACPNAMGCDQNNVLQPQAPLAGGSTREDIERREMLISVALRIVEREPQQAMALAQMSFPLGLSPNFSRLLTLMRANEPGLADLLFSSAVARLEHLPVVDLGDIHTLGSYLVSAGSSAREAMGRALVTRFLNLAFDQIANRGETATIAGTRTARRDESAAVYFIGRQLTDLFARYQPDRLEQLQREISELIETGPPDSVIELVSYEASGPAEMEADALQIGDAQKRDALYARAALAWLAKDEPRRAQSAAFEIADPEMRDRVLGQLVRKHSAEGRVEDAIAVARRIEDISSRVDALVMLAGSVASKNHPRAIEVLNEAESNSAKLRTPAARVNSLLKVASTVSAFDPPRAFEIMQSVVKAINEAGSQQDEPKQAGSPRVSSSDLSKSRIGESYTPALESTLAVLARADFDRALLVAQQIEVKEATVTAQLAVCRGGLAPKPSSNISTTADGIEASANPGADN